MERLECAAAGRGPRRMWDFWRPLDQKRHGPDVARRKPVDDVEGSPAQCLARSEHPGACCRAGDLIAAPTDSRRRVLDIYGLDGEVDNARLIQRMKVDMEIEFSL